jgi:thymidylate synthase ThyX|tara:strand:- start:2254 stop:2661 length:408 start_codon:yes stop_codon:yes gene_type:complete
MQVFPKYPKTSGSHISQRRINKQKEAVINVLQTKQPQILAAFKQLAKRHSKQPKIELHIEQAIDKVNNACVTYDSDDLHGESDDYRMWIPAAKCNDTYLLGTMLHEALHYICTFDGNDICSKDEHYVMRLLGDDC